jgi:hypothetical protein
MDMSASVAGIISDAPTPSMSASPTNRLDTDHDNAASSEPTPNSRPPITNIVRWPWRSPRRPPMMSSDANTSE